MTRPDVADRRPQRRQGPPERAARRLVVGLRPEHGRQLVARERPTLGGDERDDGKRLARVDDDRPPADGDLERTEEADRERRRATGHRVTVLDTRTHPVTLSGRSGCHHPAMSRWHRVAVVAPFVAVTFAVVDLVLAWGGATPDGDVWITVGGMIAFTIVGGLIETRRPGQVVGRICLTIGSLLIVSGLLALTAATLDARPGRMPPLGALLAVIGTAGLPLLLLGGGPLLVSQFPEGREPGRLAGLIDGMLVLSGALFLLTIFKPGPITTG